MKKGLKVVSLFEIKPEAIKVTMPNYPDTVQLGDVRNVNFAAVVGGGV